MAGCPAQPRRFERPVTSFGGKMEAALEYVKVAFALKDCFGLVDRSEQFEVGDVEAALRL